MREGKSPNAGGTGHMDRIFDRTVPPAGLGRLILFSRVLTIMDHQIGPG